MIVLISKRIFLFLLSVSTYGAVALDCRPFEIYPNISLLKPSAVELTHNSVANLMNKISNLPGHGNFASLYQLKRTRATLSKELSLLTCVYAYLSSDFDKDGVMDWKVATEEQLFDRPVPHDSDWDNDGLDNFFDASPFETTTSKNDGVIPSHLRLHNDSSHPLNLVQQHLFKSCGILALNHTDNHHYQTLNSLLKICGKIFGSKKNKEGFLVVYAFAGHTVINDSAAYFFPQLNFMSVGGQSVQSESLSEKRIIGTLAHELGHYFAFNELKVEDLIDLAETYGHWVLPKSEKKRSKFDSDLITASASHTSGFFPTEYSRKNIHEWFSEVFSLHIQRHFIKDSDHIPELPAGLEAWIQTKLSP